MSSRRQSPLRSRARPSITWLRHRRLIWQVLGHEISLHTRLRTLPRQRLLLPLRSNPPLLIDALRHILHHTVQLPSHSLLHLILIQPSRNPAQRILHLRSSSLNISLRRHPSKPLTNLVLDHTLDILGRQLTRLRLVDHFLQSVHVECRGCRGW
jgi:hypothetical protein